ncbi:patatin-like phospholipase family protein [Klebsiella variicola]|uniref:patatin-like phospholipase family protein n=1 Tax=Klebsiella variicola TaxID=244366 RepID=UPI0025571FD3|nr:patatin-like phospholipase family protein [Klebsiella variicola]MDK6228197.1 patatin-like phospholipase family protein [Klebsiella variicola]
MKKLECYAVFEGGGTKGAAFAGALKAAHESNIIFKGYGGASAGAIVAFLATLGYSGDQIRESMQKNKFYSVLDPHLRWTLMYFNTLSKFKERVEDFLFLSKKRSVLNPLKTIGWMSRNLMFFVLYMNPLSILIYLFYMVKLILWKGVFSKKRMVNLFIHYAESKIPGCITENGGENDVYLSFKKLKELTGVDLKVISTDIVTGRVVEFSYDNSPDECVLASLAASSTYPLFFQPTKINMSLLVDGGVSCNLPTFLFSDSKYKKLPIYAFDLMLENNNKAESNKLGFFNFLHKLAMASLDASNNIISETVGGISVPVKVPGKYGTFNFGLNEKDINSLFNSGYESAGDFFQKHPLTNMLTNLQKSYQLAKVLYGNLDYFLMVMHKHFESLLPPGVGLKYWIYGDISHESNEILSFSWWANNNLPIKYHQYNLNNNSIDCVRAWNENKLLWSYNPSTCVTRICHPITRSLDLSGQELSFDAHKDIIALLCIDVHLDFKNCPFLIERNSSEDDKYNGFDFHGSFATILQGYSLIIRNSILGQQIIFHESKNGR